MVPVVAMLCRVEANTYKAAVSLVDHAGVLYSLDVTLLFGLFTYILR